MNYKQFFAEIGISEQNLNDYFSESKYGGYPEEAGGSVWTNEGKSIFTLIRHFKPKRILELGNLQGVSSNHILQAVEINGFGEVTLLDISDFIDYQKIHNNNYTRVISDSLKYLEEPFDFDFIIVDDNHEYEHVKKEFSLIFKNNKCQNYFIWAHDYGVEGVKEIGVKQAWDELEKSVNQKSYKVTGEGTPCGFVFSKVG